LFDENEDEYDKYLKRVLEITKKKKKRRRKKERKKERKEEEIYLLLFGLCCSLHLIK